MKLSPNRGFTLIELLVVISIIGLLSSIVLASVGAARDKGKNTAIKLNADTVKTQTFIYFDTYHNYGSVPLQNTPCDQLAGYQVSENMFADPVIQAAIRVAEKITGVYNARCSTEDAGSSPDGSANAWVLSVPIAGDPDHYWCIDGLGDSGLLLSTVAPVIHHYCFEVAP